jgi:hypothetical protein
MFRSSLSSGCRYCAPWVNSKFLVIKYPITAIVLYVRVVFCFPTELVYVVCVSNSKGPPFRLAALYRCNHFNESKLMEFIMIQPFCYRRTHIRVFFSSYIEIKTASVVYGQSSWLQIQRLQVRFPALPDFLRSSASGMGFTQPRERNWGATWKK